MREREDGMRKRGYKQMEGKENKRNYEEQRKEMETDESIRSLYCEMTLQKILIH